MSNKKDDRKKLIVRYRFDDKGKVEFIDPCCDDMPMKLFGDIMKSLCEVQTEYNKDKH